MRAATGFLTVPAIAEELGVKVEKVLGWIHSGELRGIDVSQRRGGKPRWRIRPEDYEAFLEVRSSRMASPPVKATRLRKRLASNVTEFF